MCFEKQRSVEGGALNGAPTHAAYRLLGNGAAIGSRCASVGIRACGSGRSATIYSWQVPDIVPRITEHSAACLRMPK